MYFKKMVGKRCYLSPIDINDVEKYTLWLNDMEVAVNLGSYSLVLNEITEKEALIKISKEHNYSIIDNETNELIGILGFIDIDHINQTAEVGIAIGNKKYWDKGYGTEAIQLLLDYGFKALNFHNVLIRVYSFNTRAKKCYEKVGFKEIGSRREALKRENKIYDIVYMDIINKDFYNKYKKE
jgi:RimJ/RimL family protein N-acetyltransferase